MLLSPDFVADISMWSQRFHKISRKQVDNKILFCQVTTKICKITTYSIHSLFSVIKNNICTCFVDFQKAHNLIWNKSLKYSGIKRKFFHTVNSMYASIKLSKGFKLTVDLIKQVIILSTIYFDISIYIYILNYIYIYIIFSLKKLFNIAKYSYF